MSEPLDLDQIDSVSRSGFLTVPPETVRELTSTIRARDVRIGELEKGLKPFAKVGGTLIGNSIQYSIRSVALWMAFSASVIKCGDPWTPTCQEMWTEACAGYQVLAKAVQP